MTLTGRRARWVVGALIASLALNLFVAGIFLSGVLMRPGGHDRGIHRLLHDMPEPQRDAVKTAFEARRPELRQRLMALKDARGELKAVIRATPMASPEALEDALARVAARDREMQDLTSDLVVEGWRRAASAPR